MWTCLLLKYLKRFANIFLSSSLSKTVEEKRVRVIFVVVCKVMNEGRVYVRWERYLCKWSSLTHVSQSRAMQIPASRWQSFVASAGDGCVCGVCVCVVLCSCAGWVFIVPFTYTTYSPYQVHLFRNDTSCSCDCLVWHNQKVGNITSQVTVQTITCVVSQYELSFIVLLCLNSVNVLLICYWNEVVYGLVVMFCTIISLQCNCQTRITFLSKSC